MPLGPITQFIMHSLGPNAFARMREDALEEAHPMGQPDIREADFCSGIDVDNIISQDSDEVMSRLKEVGLA